MKVTSEGWREKGGKREIGLDFGSRMGMMDDSTEVQFGYLRRTHGLIDA